MTPEKMEEFEQDLAAYSFGFQQDAVQYLKTLKQLGYGLDDLHDYVKAKQIILGKLQAEKGELSQQCPECPALMLLLPINDKPETQTGDNSKSVWLCQNKKCMNTIYNTQTLEELSSKGGT